MIQKPLRTPLTLRAPAFLPVRFSPSCPCCLPRRPLSPFLLVSAGNRRRQKNHPLHLQFKSLQTIHYNLSNLTRLALKGTVLFFSQMMVLSDISISTLYLLTSRIHYPFTCMRTLPQPAIGAKKSSGSGSFGNM